MHRIANRLWLGYMWVNETAWAAAYEMTGWLPLVRTLRRLDREVGEQQRLLTEQQRIIERLVTKIGPAIDELLAEAGVLRDRSRKPLLKLVGPDETA